MARPYQKKQDRTRRSVATLLREQIQRAGVSHRVLAKLARTSPGQLNRILDPEYEPKVKLESVQRVAKCLGLKARIVLIDEVSDIEVPYVTVCDTINYWMRLAHKRKERIEELEALLARKSEDEEVHPEDERSTGSLD